MGLRKAYRAAAWAGALVCALSASGCNSPYPESEKDERILYTTFIEEPKHLDPAQSYSSGESYFMWQTLEPPFQYHFLKRPYEMVPLTAEAIPKVRRRSVTFGGGSVDAPTYTIRIRKGIRYQNHPCFVEANRRMTAADARGVYALSDIKATATRELVAGDFVHAIRRLADPRLACPIFSTLAKNMLGLTEYQQHLQRTLDAEQRKRSEAGGALYNQEQDEKYNPIHLDLAAGAADFPFVREVDAHAFEVVLKRPYPQILYWMAMAFFAPIPPEAVAFHDQPVMRERSILLDKSPVGTGPFRLELYDPTNQITFVRNENFREDRYPDLPVPDGSDPRRTANYRDMKALGMLDDVGRMLPMVDRIVFRLEKESIPRWNKFLQGYYDSSGISSDTFDQTVTLTSTGDSVLSDEIAERGVRLLTSAPIQVGFYAFNMNDPVVGGYTEAKRKLRQAISIAFDVEEEIAIFANGRGIPAHSPVPPGVFGHEEGEAGINPVVYRWDAQRSRPVRRSLAEAKKLLAEAGYPNGYSADGGEQLVIRYASVASTGEARALLKFIRKQLAKLNIRMETENTDGNQFTDKVLKGNYQMLHWGWIADYPDPENFLFLLYGPNGKTVSGGENVPNYSNPEYDRLFEQMESMENTPERLAIIRKMHALLRRDAPWVFDYHPISFGLYHRWYGNAHPHSLAYNRTKYARLDVADRSAYRRKHNAPLIWPIAIFAALLIAATIPALRAAARHFKEA